MLTAAILTAYFFATFSDLILYFHIKKVIITYYWLQERSSSLALFYYDRLTRFERFCLDRL